MNDSWLLLPSLRYACGQLLAGSIAMNSNNEAVIVNTVETYGRGRSMDVHRERFVNKKGVPVPSSLPPLLTKYPNTWATMLNDSEGKKLVFGTKMCNALVTSSMRIDKDRPASVGGTIVHFDLDPQNAETTTILLDADSIKKANALTQDPHANKIGRFDLLEQLRQLRTKFQYPSTYALCRVSSEFTNDIRRRPYTVFTLANFDGGQQDSGTMIASQLIAHDGFCVTNSESVIGVKFVNKLISKCPHGQIKNLLLGVPELAVDGCRIRVELI